MRIATDKNGDFTGSLEVFLPGPTGKGEWITTTIKDWNEGIEKVVKPATDVQATDK